MVFFFLKNNFHAAYNLASLTNVSYNAIIMTSKRNKEGKVYMIDIRNLSKSYDGKNLANDNLNLQIQDGEILGVLGPNGAGKSTLLKTIVGILQPDKGEIVINGKTFAKDAEKYKKEFAYVSDTPDNLLRLTGFEFLRFLADVYEVPVDVRKKRIHDLLVDFDMENALANELRSYSHGMRQKIMVVGALLVNPNVWILDEPMVGLDPRSAFVMKQKMRQHADSGKIVLFSTHVMEVAEKIVDRICVINKGKIIFVGTVSALRNLMHENASLEQMFLELTDENIDILNNNESI